MRYNRQSIVLKSLSVLSILLFILAGCVDVPVKEKPVEEAATEAVFYPRLPDPPRIQYLATFSSTRDLDSGEDIGGFGRFILGDELDRDVEGVAKPYGVAMFEGKIYVADTRGGGYGIFDLKDQKYRFVTGSGASEMPKPINITIDNDGTKYVTDTVRNQVLVFDRDDVYQQAFGTKGQFKPGDVAIAGSMLYVADIDHHVIQVLDKSTGELLNTFGRVGSNNGELYHPTNLAIGPDDNLYISDTGNFRIQTFTLDGEFVKATGKVGNAPGSFTRPKGVALDHEGLLYVVDAAFENVQVFNSDGELLMIFGESAANHPSGLDLPTDISLSYSGVTYFQQYADPKFKLDYVILVASQFGRNKVNVYGFGHMDGMSYFDDE